MRIWTRRKSLFATGATGSIGGHTSLAAEPKHTSPRERILINDNWRFIKGDPSGNTVSLLYDLRPQRPKPSGTETQADANAVVNESVTPNKPARASPAVIKQWILPTGNDFIKDPSRKFVRPSGNPGDGGAYSQPDFHLIFPDWHEQDLRAHVRRDRNCPSVIMWSIGNEVSEQYTGTSGAALYGVQPQN